jgi:uncharacterized damage-inducible protein DinB
MHLNPDEAKFITGLTVADYEREVPITKAVIAAIPAGKELYSPDTKSMPALKLAWHIASSEAAMLEAAINGSYKPSSGMPDSIRTAADVLAWYDATLPAIVERVKAAPGESLAKIVSFFGVMELPAMSYVNAMVKHSIHHRGQLSAYLRPMGAKVPGIYGPSADTV